jgi:hypothetical protein
VKDLAFSDMLGLLGYDSNVNFASIDSIFYRALDYEAATSVLRPMYSFTNLDGQFKKILGVKDRKETCNLQLLYKEWINYMYDRQNISDGLGNGM